MAQAGLRVDDAWVAMSAPSQDSIRLALHRMLAGPAPVTALFFGNNRISVAAVRELRALAGTYELGRGPAFAGFDDFELADMLSPGVTVVAQDVVRLGRVAAQLLFRRLAGDRGPAERIDRHAAHRAWLRGDSAELVATCGVCPISSGSSR